MSSRRLRIPVALGILAYLVLGTTIVVSSLYREKTDDLEHHALTALFEGDRAMVGLEFARAEKKYRLATDLFRASAGTREAESHASYAEAFDGWGDALKAQGRYRDAVKRYARAVEVYERADGPLAVALLGPLYNLEQIHRAMGRDSLANYCAVRVDSIASYHVRVVEAEVARLREVGGGGGAGAAGAGGAGDGDSAQAELLADRLMGLGNLYIAQGMNNRAEIAFLEAYEIRARLYGPRYLDTADAQYYRGMAAALMGKNGVATTTLDSSLALHQGSFGKDTHYLAEEMSMLGEVAFDQGKYAEADSLYGRVLAALERTIGRDQYYSLETMGKVAECAAELGRFAEARAMLERVHFIQRRAHGDVSYPAGIALLEIAELEERAGSVPRARATCVKALAVLEKAVGPRHPSVAEARYYLSELDSTETTPSDVAEDLPAA